MKIDVELPVEFERKWKRLRAYLRDDQILALAAIDLLWERNGDDVCRAERLKNAHAKRLQNCKRRLDGLLMRLPDAAMHEQVPVFVGRFRRRLDENGLLALPSAWLAALEKPQFVCLCRKKSDGEVWLLAERDVDSVSPCEAKVVRKAVDEMGRIAIPAKWRGRGTSVGIVLVGKLRYAVIGTRCNGEKK